MKVAVTQTINAAHQLPGTELHGHTYRITAIIDNTLGFCGGWTFDVLKQQLSRCVSELDHRQLEKIIGEPATAERVAEYVRAEMRVACRIRVEVGDDGWVETE